MPSNRKQLVIENSDDNVLILPESIDIYQQELGKKTRQHLRYYKKQLEFYISENNQILEQKSINFADLKNPEKIFTDIYRLNAERCLSKGFNSGARKQWYSVFIKYGRVSLLLLNNEVIAGTIYTVIEDKLFLHIISHDNFYNKYNIGNIVLLNTIEDAITNKIKEFHFLWGNCDYKKRFGAISIPIYTVCIYRKIYLYYFDKIKLQIIPHCLLGIKEISNKQKKAIKLTLKKLGLFDSTKKIYNKWTHK